MPLRALRSGGVALVIALLWAIWWVFFAAADAIVSRRFGGAITLAVVVIGTVAIASKWRAVGGVLLILASIASVGIWGAMWIRRFNFLQIVLIFALMPLPPLAAGILLLISGHWRA